MRARIDHDGGPVQLLAYKQNGGLMLAEADYRYSEFT